MPALALGREMLLGTRLSETFTAIPDWVLLGLSGLFVVGVLPVRNWTRRDVLERSANAARRFLDELPERVMSIEAAESRGDIRLEEATKRKTQIQRDADRLAVVDGVGRLLYWLLKIHALRLSLQVAGGMVVAIWIDKHAASAAGVRASTSIVLDGLIVWLWLLLLFICLPRVPHRTPGTQSEG